MSTFEIVFIIMAITTIALIYVVYVQHTVNEQAQERAEMIADTIVEETLMQYHLNAGSAYEDPYEIDYKEVMSIHGCVTQAEVGFDYIHRSGVGFRYLRCAKDGRAILMNLNNGDLITVTGCALCHDQIVWSRCDEVFRYDTMLEEHRR